MGLLHYDHRQAEIRRENIKMVKECVIVTAFVKARLGEGVKEKVAKTLRREELSI